MNVNGNTLTLAANPWNIVRTYNLTPGRELLFACRNPRKKGKRFPLAKLDIA